MEQFFLDVLPRCLGAAPALFVQAKGSLCFEAEGEAFTVRLGNAQCPIERAIDEQAEVRLKFSPGAFEAFLEGSSEGLQIEGDPDVFRRFGILLQACALAGSRSEEQTWC